MNKILSIIVCFVLITFVSGNISADQKSALTAIKAAIDGNAAIDAPAKALVLGKLLPVITNSTLVAEVTAQNAKGVSLEEIKKIDAEWQKAEAPLPIMKEKLGNACATELKKIQSQIPAIREVFVMDNQGAIVGTSNLTSDYWQGDEDKWVKSYVGGKGGVDAAKAKFDTSANAVVQQISLPIIDGNGAIIGAVTFGIAIN